MFGFRLSTKLQGRSLRKRKTPHFVFRVEDEQVSVFVVCVVCVDRTRYGVCEGAEGH